MTTNSELAPDATRHDDDGLSTRAGVQRRNPARPIGAPAVHTRSPAAPAVAHITRAVQQQGRQITNLIRTVSAAEGRKRLQDARDRMVHQLRNTVDRRSAEIARRRPDVLTTHKIDRINAGISAVEAQLRAENAQLRKVVARPRIAPSAGRSHSARSQAFAAHRRAVLTYLRTGQETFGGLSLRDLERRALVTDTDPNGGYLVHPEQDTGPLERLMYDMSVMRQVATVRQISGASLKKPVDVLGTEAEWVGERQARADTDTPTIEELDFPAMELYAKPKASQSMLEDSFMDIEAWLSQSVADAFSLKEEIAFTSGDGVKKPFGFLSADKVANASWAWKKLGYTATGASGAFASPSAAVNQGDKLWELIYSMKAGYRTNAKWMMNSATVGVCRTLKDGEGRWIWADARDGNPAQLCGFDTVVNEQMPAIAANSYSIAFGDWTRGYIIVDRVGVTVLRDPYSAKPYVEFYTRKRVGGGIQNYEAIKLLKFASS